MKQDVGSFLGVPSGFSSSQPDSYCMLRNGCWLALLCLLLLTVFPGTSRADALGDALDAPGLTWSTTPDGAWYSETTNTHDGVDAVQSVSGYYGDSFDLIASNVQGPLAVSFWWQIDSFEGFLCLYVDDVLQLRTGSWEAWTQKAVRLSPGPHTLRWSHTPGTYDAEHGWGWGRSAWIDQVITRPPDTKYVVPGGAGSGDGSSWANAAASIQAGVDAATNGDEVWVAAGTYTGASDPVVTVKDAVAVYGGFAGTEATRAARNWTAHGTTIDGQNARQCANVNVGATLDGFTITRGTGTQGGGIFNNGTVTNCTVIANSVAATYQGGYKSVVPVPGYGGGIFNNGTVTACVITGNSTTGQFVWPDDQYSFVSPSYGGGIYNNGTVTDCTVSQNSAGYFSNGGGIYNNGTVTNCMVSGNSANGDSGGGIKNVQGMVTNCTVTSNSAEFVGGGVHSVGGTVTNCTVTGNYANADGRDYYSGGGIYSDGGTITNCIVWLNGPNDISGGFASFSCFGEAINGVDGNLRANPRFVSRSGTDQAAWNLRLQNGSPCVDTGTPDGAPATDIAGAPRPGGDGKVCMGAYESPDAYAPDGAAEPVVVAYVAPGGDNTTGSDWSTAYQTINGAVRGGANNPSFMEIRVAGATYIEGTVVVVPGRISLLGGWEGTGDPGPRDTTAYPTTVDGEDAHRCFRNSGVLDGLTAWRGRSGDYGSEDASGAGIYNTGTVMNCTVTGNYAPNYVDSPCRGGGIYNDKGTVANSTITSNTAGTNNTGGAHSGPGGGIYSDRGIVTECTVMGNSGGSGGGIYSSGGMVTGCTVAGNTAGWDGASGGGIYSEDGTVANCTVTRNSTMRWGGGGGGGVFGGTVTNCTVTENSADGSGGGICGATTVTRCTVAENSANGNVGANGNGGGISADTVTNCTVTGNSAYGSGGGISADTVTDCTVTANTANGSGGGISADTVTDCTVTANTANASGGGISADTVTDCTVTANTANASGGGIFADTVTDCTVTGNSASSAGGGVYNAGGTVTNCIAMANSAAVGGGIYNRGGVTNCTVTGNSLNGSGYGGGIDNSGGTVKNSIVWLNDSGDVSGDVSGGSVSFSCYSEAVSGAFGSVSSDPFFVSRSGSDPGAWNLHLRSTSPCKDSGALGGAPATDIEGRPRPGEDGTVSMGAYQYGSGPLPTYTLTVNKAGAGNGTVAQDPDQSSYTASTEVTLTAVPGPGSTFTGWSGDATGTAPSVIVTMNGNKAVTATFDRVPVGTYTLNVDIAGTGIGTVAKSPPDLGWYTSGTAVTLTATPSADSVFAGWSGDATGTALSVVVTMNEHRMVTATFDDNGVNARTNYKVTYKGCSVNSDDVLTGGALVVASTSEKASVKIQKVKNPDPTKMHDVDNKILYLKDCPTKFSEVQVTGSGLGTFYTDAPVGLLNVAGPLGKLSTTDAVIANVVVTGRIGSVKMGSLTSGKETSIESAGGPADSLTAGFSGVCVTGLRTQQTVKKLAVASKKTRTGVVEGVIGDSADSTATLLLAPNFGTISAAAGVHACVMAGWSDATQPVSPTHAGRVKMISTSSAGSLSGEVHLSPEAAPALKLKGPGTMKVCTDCSTP